MTSWVAINTGPVLLSIRSVLDANVDREMKLTNAAAAIAPTATSETTLRSRGVVIVGRLLSPMPLVR